MEWKSFVAGLVDHYAPRTDADRVLWRVTKTDREMTCRVREIRTTDGYIGLELRVEHNGEFDLTEHNKERLRFTQRVDELRALLEATHVN